MVFPMSALHSETAYTFQFGGAVSVTPAAPISAPDAAAAAAAAAAAGAAAAAAVVDDAKTPAVPAPDANAAASAPSAVGFPAVPLFLFEPGAEVNIALIAAVKAGNAQTVAYLLHRGPGALSGGAASTPSFPQADVNHVGDDGETPLIAAVKLGDQEVLKVLLAASPDLNKTTRHLVPAAAGVSTILECPLPGYKTIPAPPGGYALGRLDSGAANGRGTALLSDDKLEATCSDGFPTVGLKDIPLLTSGKYYYEVTVVVDRAVQLGWVREDANIDGTGNGVGDDEFGFAFDGNREMTWPDKKTIPNSRWQAGDVIGCAIDIDSRRMSFFINGRLVV